MGAREPEFSEQFLPYVCLDDSINMDAGDYTVMARIAHDDTPDKPDERQDGFWPSLDPKAAGFIGAGNGWRKRFEQQQAKAESVMAAWLNDEWFYCGIILSVSIDETIITDHAASLWGIEANYPDSDNAYLSQVANELLSEALDAAKAERERLCVLLCESAA
ncbi:MAG: hypothetical protein COB36_13270 [Alphaproteobacteria bacterium]|nr:MAG: hypothetical protein COB36_13270 [Alphaproteobacteria bacterium]